MKTWSREEWEEINRQAEKNLYYLYTPICGTCAVASKMMDVIAMMRPHLTIGKADLNYIQDVAVDYEIESVPCLLLSKNGIVEEKIYAFHSIPNLLNKIDDTSREGDYVSE